MGAVEYWNNLYRDNMPACSRRIYALSSDFIAEMQNIPSKIVDYFNLGSKYLEFGCGTGELCKLLRIWRGHGSFIGVDIASSAIKYARVHNSGPGIEYWNVNLIDDDKILNAYGKFDMVISSNTLEHFKKPFPVIDKLLTYGEFLLLLVPYNDVLSDGYDEEGGAGHVYSFNEHSFSDYNVLTWFTFFTHEWVSGPNPLQIAILITKK